MKTKTRTVPLKPSAYLRNGSVNIATLTDDAITALESIEFNGYGEGNRKRSRRVIYGSMRTILDQAGYDAKSREIALQNLKDIHALNQNAE